MSVIHVSDLHFVRGDRRMREFLAGLPEADVAVLTGDVVGEPEAVEEATAALHPVRGRAASIVVLGSNDYYRPTPINYLRYFQGSRRPRVGRLGRGAELIEQLTADGWTYLRNERVSTDLDGTPAEIVGLDDAHILRHDLRTAVRSAPDRFGLAVLHSPDPAPELAALGYELIIAGHTHGGQVRMPIAGALVTNSQLPRRLSAGLIRIGPAFLNISAGLGTSKYAPFRFLCPPEATLLELAPRKR